MNKRWVGFAVLCLAALWLVSCGVTAPPTRKAPATEFEVTREPTRVPPPTPASPPTAEATAIPVADSPCVTCHQDVSPGIANDWRDGAHGAAGVDCADCHVPKDAANRPDSFSHNGVDIVTLVTPAQCAACHPQESAEFEASPHANAAQLVDSPDNFLGEVVAGGPAADAGCKQCHGSTVQLGTEPGKLDPMTWPNTGIGRINPDGSLGTCTACHTRHSFSIAQARQPETCDKCHLGPDHPQEEIWRESEHGSRYYETLNDGWYPEFDAPAGEWWPGREYYMAGPTCAGCHISATPNQRVTHDVSTRLSWTLQPDISVKQDNWEEKRAAMQDVCAQCHSPQFTENFYFQFDAMVNLYNTKFAAPARQVMDKLYADGKLTQTPFDEEIEWVYYELWHRAGRRARQGAAMGSPDYAWSNGMYDVSKDFYAGWIPLARELDPAAVDEVLSGAEHQWLQGLSEEEIQQTIDYYRQRYGRQP